MKTFAFSSTAALVCILVFGRTALGQYGDGYYCWCCTSMCPVSGCMSSGGGNCWPGMGDSHGLMRGKSTDVFYCTQGSGTCNNTYWQQACWIKYFTTVDLLGNCSGLCGYDIETFLTCPLNGP